MADVNRGNCPLSPHLTVYRPQLTSMSSILVRITGPAMLISGLLTSVFGDLVMALSVLGLWYHALGGLRHLIWDQGYALDVETSEKMALGMMGGSVVLTLITLIAV